MIILNKVFISEEGNILQYKDLLNNPKISGHIEYDTDDKIGLVTLHNLDIKDHFRRRGFATNLIKFIIKKIKRLNISKIITTPHSYSNNFSTEDLISFYKKNFKELGAVEIKERVLYQGKVELIAIF